MKRFFLAILVLGVAASCGGSSGGGSDPVAQPPPSGISASEQLAADLTGLPLDEFYEESLKALTYRSPETIIWQALQTVYPLNSVGLDDFSDEYQRETFAMDQVGQ